MANTQTDLQRAFKAISDKVSDIDTLYSYYDGEPSLKYTTERLARAFDKTFVYFAENWAAVIVDAVLDRLVLKGFDAQEEGLNSKVDDYFTRKNLNLDAQDVHEALQIVGEAFLIVDNTEEGVEVYFNDPRMCEMFYDADRPKVKDFAAKKWHGRDNKWHLNLYYPNRTEKYTSQGGNTANSFELSSTEPNETGVIPVFHFKNSRRIIKGEFDPSILSMFDAINKLFSDLLVAAEFETFKIKVFISQQNPGNTEIGPDMKMWIPANEGEGEPTKVIELGGTDLKKFLDPINDIATSLAIQTRTPRHYFMNVGSNLSGEALIVEESALVKKVIKKQEAYAPVWQEFMAYVLKLQGTEIDPADLLPVWEKPQSVQPLTNAQILKTESEAGVPLINSARRLGFDESEIQQLEQDLQASQPDTSEGEPQE